MGSLEAIGSEGWRIASINNYVVVCNVAAAQKSKCVETQYVGTAGNDAKGGGPFCHNLPWPICYTRIIIRRLLPASHQLLLRSGYTNVSFLETLDEMLIFFPHHIRKDFLGA